MTFLLTLQQLENPISTLGRTDKESLQFFTRFLIDIVSVFILIRFIYYRNYKRTDLFLTFFGFNIIIFLITYLLNKVEMSMGAAFGLFAVFSMLRYRTEGISAKDMTYLFFSIAIGLLTAVGNGQWYDIAFMNFILLALTAVLESNIIAKKEYTKAVIYDNIQLITPDKKAALLSDLRARTGLNIHRVDVHDYDFLKDAANLTVYYYKEPEATPKAMPTGIDLSQTVPHTLNGSHRVKTL